MADFMGDEDPLVGEFSALREAVAEQLRSMARLEVALGQVQGEVARKTGPEAFKETFAAIRQDVAGLCKRLEQQEAAFDEVPDAAAIGVAVKEGVAGLTQDLAQTRVVVRDAAAAARDAAEQGRDAARGAAKHAHSVREVLLSDRTTMVLMTAAMLAMGVLGLGTGWGLRGWWAPTPAGVFARYLSAGNDPEWLLCGGGGGQRFTDHNAPACDLKFWLAKPEP